MAVALPPPITPQLEPLAEIRVQGEHAVQLHYKGIQIFLTGKLASSGAVNPGLMQELISRADTISTAVRAIGALYYAAGYPATIITYAVADPHDLFIRAEPGRVSDVRGPEPISSYFDNLKSHATLTESGLESDRVLADALSERGGLNYQSELVPLGGDAVALDLGTPAETGKQTGIIGGFSNYGTRYSGPYLADLTLRQSFSTGDELTLAGFTGVRALGLGGPQSEPYHEGDVGYSRVTRFGVFGLQGRYVNFQQKVELSESDSLLTAAGGLLGALGLDSTLGALGLGGLLGIPGPAGTTIETLGLDGKIGAGSATWLYPLYADFQRRFNLQAKFDRNYETVTLQGDTRLLSELYNSVEADLSYVQRVPLGSDELQVQLAVAARKGLSPEHTANTAANLAYFLWRPSLNVSYVLGAHWSLVGEGSLQLAGSRVPQLEQLVLGGPAAEHAFEAGAGVGDRGENVRLSVNWKDIGDGWLARYQVHPRAFVEYGHSTLSSVEPTEPAGRIEIADAGADIDAHLTHWLEATLSGAKSIEQHGHDSSPDGLAKKYVFFRITARY